MHRALELAQRAIGAVGPHALVGAVVVKGDEIVGEGYYKHYGDRHAEAQALERAGGAAKGAELFVNLEPCCHTGRNPACTETIIKAGVLRVVFSVTDPNPKVSGEGYQTLKAAGLHVEYGLLADEASELNRAFMKFVVTRKPWIFRMVNQEFPKNGLLLGQSVVSSAQTMIPVMDLSTTTPPFPQPTKSGWPSIGWINLDGVENKAEVVSTAVARSTYARIPFLILHSSKWIDTKEIIDEDKTQHCRLRISKLVSLDTSHGKFQAAGFQCDEHKISGMLVGNSPDKKKGVVPLRIQSECMPAHVLHNTHCDCDQQLQEGLDTVAKGGILIYLSGHEGRGLGITNKLNEYALREWHHEVPFRDVRNFLCTASVLLAFNVKTVKLLTKNKDKASALTESGIKLA